MSNTLRGADIVVQSLKRLGCDRIFTLSGNHIMSVFDATLDAGVDLVHVRHEAAAVHMADAYGRLTGKAGVALVTGGPGHANAVGALFAALNAETPLLLLSGHAATWELGRGGFQELRQAEMAAPATKASWMTKSITTLGSDIGEALRIAISGRPGPVHLSLPSDVLEATSEANAVAWPEQTTRCGPPPDESAISDIARALRAACRPVIIAGPQLSTVKGRELLARLELATGAPAVISESPRGLSDATLGAFATAVTPHADLILLLGKALDFSIKWAQPPTFHPDVEVIVIDPDPDVIARARNETSVRFQTTCVADPTMAGEALIRQSHARRDAWIKEARSAIDTRPHEWRALRAKSAGRMHAAEVFYVLKPYIESNPDAVLISDGGEFTQWGQAILPLRRRLTNSITGGIGSSIPFAVSARLVERNAPVFAMLGDGAAGFHISEFETAARLGLPFVAIVGNDARWNAESVIQKNKYGAPRMHNCELLPARYDQVAAAFGAHGELATTSAELASAIDRALASGKPTCINVMIEGAAAPTYGGAAQPF